VKALISQSLCPWLAAPLARLAAASDTGRLGHGWLISGPRGIGKANLVFALASRLLGQQRDVRLPLASPRQIIAAYDELALPIDLHPDLHRVRPEEDKHSIGIDQVRAMTSDLALKSHAGGTKIVVLAPADQMTIEASNALLKTLEEPTPNTYLFLLAERPGRLPATIRSRCQHLALRGPAPDVAREWLETDGGDTEALPAGLLERQPIAAARLVMSADDLSKYKELQDNIHLLLDGSLDPHELARSWSAGDTELALACLIENLRSTIRDCLVPAHSNLITDPGGHLTQNSGRRVAVNTLFAGLQMAENLREQLGRGINVELNLKSILVGLERGDARRLNS
jgi:DNA polymerase-3 subunit delta'